MGVERTGIFRRQEQVNSESCSILLRSLIWKTTVFSGRGDGNRVWLNNKRLVCFTNLLIAQRRRYGIWWKYEFIVGHFCFQNTSCILPNSFLCSYFILPPPGNLIPYPCHSINSINYSRSILNIFLMKLCCLNHLKPELIFPTSKFGLSTKSLSHNIIM